MSTTHSKARVNCIRLHLFVLTWVHPPPPPLQTSCASQSACQAQAAASAVLEPPGACPCCSFPCTGGEVPPCSECGPAHGVCPCNNHELSSPEVLDIGWLTWEVLAKGQA